jgi:hypothetical protein
MVMFANKDLLEIRFENVIFVILVDTVCKHKHGTCLTK